MCILITLDIYLINTIKYTVQQSKWNLLMLSWVHRVEYSL